MLKQSNIKILKNGFTLLEILVAIFVITIGLIAAVSLIQRAAILTSLSSDRLTAAYLTQEGIEIVRNQRDTNWLRRVNWKENLTSRTEPGILGKFNRTITITEIVPNVLNVLVKVNWQDRGRDYDFSAQENLYNWKP